MRELVGLIALIGALLGIFLIWGSGDRSGLLWLLLLTGACLFLQYLSLSGSNVLGTPRCGQFPRPRGGDVRCPRPRRPSPGHPRRRQPMRARTALAVMSAV